MFNRIKCASNLAKQKCMQHENIETGLPWVVSQSIRHRMWRTAPKNKSKIFYVPEPKHEDPEEHEELKARYRVYRATMKAIRSKFYKDNQVFMETMTAGKSDEDIATEDREHIENLEINDKWNQAIALERKAFEEQRRLKEERKKLLYLYNEEKKRLKRQQRAEEIVQREMEASKTFITKENLDSVIEQALNSKQDYNFAIDPQGQRIGQGSEMEGENKGKPHSLKDLEDFDRNKQEWEKDFAHAPRKL
ncbi:unnamed protein product [Owenia fusiformis]|uniref:Small ribosomal subunit protein mS26 n=1 Tax=Owenia fusiformis TaxID=6347 RepID=A0A8J1T6X9_OWEFU|nr:unnamed protein product [Owenia fusiformis]